MIGKVIVGGNFYETIRYVLEDKKDMTEEQKIEQSILEGVQHIDRAEVLAYNKCSGDAKRLAAQFLEVKNLNKRVEKPVFHFFLRLAPEDDLSRKNLIEMGEACVKEFGVDDNQYIMVYHKDSQQPHIHIVANRVGFDGKVAKDFQNYKTMDAFCRRIEKEFHLKEVLSAKRYLSKELRHLPRHNTRFEKLKKDIQQTLEKVTTYQQFESTMKSLGYAVLKGRGICFIDEKKVRIKGSEVGFPLARIEKVLELKMNIVQKQERLKTKKELHSIADAKQEQKEKRLEENGQPQLAAAAKLVRQFAGKEKQEEVTALEEDITVLQKTVKEAIYILMKPEQVDQSISEFERQVKKKRKRQHLSHW
jgi:hypothetical protein